MKKNSIILVALLLFTSVQGQWINEKGKGYYKIGSWSLLADEHYTDQGIVDPNATEGFLLIAYTLNTAYQQRSISLHISRF
jgi:hypothetical protein